MGSSGAVSVPDDALRFRRWRTFRPPYSALRRLRQFYHDVWTTAEERGDRSLAPNQSRSIALFRYAETILAADGTFLVPVLLGGVWRLLGRFRRGSHQRMRNRRTVQRKLVGWRERRPP